MKLHTFQELVSRVVNLSTRDKKSISVTWSGTNAYTNTKTVNLPSLPAGTILTTHQFSIWMGYTIHEGPGHQTHTDLFLYTNTCQQRNNPTFSYILNLLEDIRIENADLKIYPGDRKYLDTVHYFVDQKIPNHLASNPDTMGLIYKHLFTHHRNLDTNIIKGNLDPTTAKLISKIDLCHSTQDCINLADKIISYLKQKPSNEDENENETQNSNNDPGPNEPSEETGTEINSNGTGSGMGNDPKDEAKANNQNQNKSKENTNQSKEGTGFSFNINQSADLWQELTEIKNIIQDLKNQIDKDLKSFPTPDPDRNLDGKSIFPPVNIFNDRIYVPSREDIKTYNHTRAAATSQILTLKKMFRIYLQAQTQKSTIRGLEEGKLDTQRLYIAATGSKTIFKDKTTKPLPETAIELMIDMSSSMDANIARQAAIILSEALNSIPQIKLSISGFTTNYNAGYDPYRINPNFGRHNGMDILQFKDFNEPYAKCKAKLGAINNSGATPLGDAYGHALEHLIPRTEPRRIIFLITDGKPEFTHGQNHSDYLLMQKIHHTATKYHIQTLGLGIGSNLEFLNNYFDRVVNISETETLPKNLLEALKFFI